MNDTKIGAGLLVRVLLTAVLLVLTAKMAFACSPLARSLPAGTQIIEPVAERVRSG